MAFSLFIDHSHLARLHRKMAAFHKDAGAVCRELPTFMKPRPVTRRAAPASAKRRGQRIEPGEGFGDVAQRTAASTVTMAKGRYGDGVYGDDDLSGGLRKAAH